MDSNVFVFTSGAVSVMPLDFDFSTITALGAEGALYDVSTDGGVDVGLLSADSPIEIGKEFSTNTLRAYQNDAVVRLVSNEASVTATLGFLEDTLLTRELYWGTAEENGVTAIKPGVIKRVKFVIDVTSDDIDGKGTAGIRRYLLDGQIEAVETISVAYGEPEIKSVTLRAFTDADTGVAAYMVNMEIPADEDPEEG